MRGGIPTAILVLCCLVGCRSLTLRPGASWDPVADIESKVTMARYYERDKNFPHAKQLYQEILAGDPSNANAHHRLGVINVRQGQLEEGLTHLRRARAIDPKNAELMTDLGYTLYLQNQFSDAGVALQEALVVDPGNKRAMNNLALVMGKQGNINEAHSMFRQVGNDATAHANLAFLYAQSGQYEEAEEHYNQALDYDSELEVAAQGLLELVQRRSQGGDISSVAKREEKPSLPQKRLRGLTSIHQEDRQSDDNEDRMSRAEMAQFVSQLREMIATKQASAEVPIADEEAPQQKSIKRQSHTHFGTVDEVRTQNEITPPRRIVE